MIDQLQNPNAPRRREPLHFPGMKHKPGARRARRPTDNSRCMLEVYANFQGVQGPRAPWGTVAVSTAAIGAYRESEGRRSNGRGAPINRGVVTGALLLEGPGLDPGLAWPFFKYYRSSWWCFGSMEFDNTELPEDNLEGLLRFCPSRMNDRVRTRTSALPSCRARAMSWHCR